MDLKNQQPASQSGPSRSPVAFDELERAVHAALETYSNVHRGTGHNSLITTNLYERARNIVLQYLGLRKSGYVVLFCTPARAKALQSVLKPNRFRIASSADIGLPLGVRALAIKRRALPKGMPFQTGGGTATLMSPDWVVWSGAPDRFEAGTPAIVNIIAFSKALQLLGVSGSNFMEIPAAEKTGSGEILYHDEMDEYSGPELLVRLRETLIGRNMQVPTIKGSRPFINFDNAASTRTFLPVWNTVRQTWRQSPSVQQEIVSEVKSICSGALGAPPEDYEVIFTSNTTEAINLAAESLNKETEPDLEPVVLNTLLEHSSNDLPWRRFPGVSLIRLPVDPEGIIDLKELETILSEYNRTGKHGSKRIRIVALSGASNVLGTCNDLGVISRIVHLYGARLLVDATQLVAHRRIEMKDNDIDYLAFSAHKVYAPFGCGVLIARKGLLRFSPGEMEIIRLSGEENTGGIAALGKALLLLKRIGLDHIRDEEQALTAQALKGLSGIPELKLFGLTDPDSPAFTQRGAVIVFTLRNLMANVIARELAMRGGIGVRSGCHCSHILVKRLLGVSPGLERFQRILVTLIPKIQLPGIARISLGLENNPQEIETLVQVLGEIDGKLPREAHKEMKQFVMAAARRVYTNP